MEVEYDPEDDTLRLYDHDAEDYAGSVGVGGIILDLNEKRKIIGIEILSASNKMKMTRKELKEMVVANGSGTD